MAKAHTLVDNFNDNQTDTSKWTAFGPVQEVNERLEIRPESGVALSVGGYDSASAYDLTESQVVVECVLPTRTGGAALIVYNAPYDSGDRAFVIFTPRFVNTNAVVSGVITTLPLIGYDATVHRWMRLRESRGTLYFETSRD